MVNTRYRTSPISSDIFLKPKEAELDFIFTIIYTENTWTVLLYNRD